jgi:hypothetical protein
MRLHRVRQRYDLAGRHTQLTVEKDPLQPEQCGPAMVAVTIRPDMGRGEQSDLVMMVQCAHR